MQAENDDQSSDVKLLVGLSYAFRDKEVRPGFNKEALRQFAAKEISLAQLVTHITSGGAFSPGTFEGGIRKKENFLQGQILALDCDDNVSVLDCMADDFVNSHAFFIGATASSGAKFDDEGKPIHKTRVLFRLDQPITDRAEFERLQMTLIKHLSHLRPDPAAKDASRFFYGSTHIHFIPRLDRVLPLEVMSGLADDLDLQHRQARSQAENERIQGQNERLVNDDRKRSRMEKYALKALQRKADELASMGEGGRNTTLFRFGAQMGNMVAAGMIDYNEVYRVLRDAALACGLSDQEIDKTLPRAINEGMATPYDLSKFERSAKTETLLQEATQADEAEAETPPLSQRINRDAYVPEFAADIDINVLFVTEKHLFEAAGEASTIALKSPLGTGKTAAIEQYAKRIIERGGTVLYISLLTNLNSDAARRLGLADATEAKRDGTLNEHRGLAITLDSLDWVELQGWDLVILDEWTQTLRHAWGDTMRGGEHLQAWRALRKVIKWGGLVVALDAHMNHAAVEVLKRWRADVVTICNDYCPDRGEMMVYADRHKLLERAFARVDENDGLIVVVCDALKTSREVGQAGRERYGRHAVRIINSETSQSEAAQKLLRDLKAGEIPEGLRLLVVSPSLATGIDINTPVAGVFGIFDNHKVLASDMMQMMMRFRRSDERGAYIRYAYRGELEFDTRAIYRHRAQKLNIGKKYASIASDNDPTLIEIEWARALVDAEANRQYLDAASTFVRLAEAEGFEVSIIDDECAAMKASMKESRKRLSEQDKRAALNAMSIMTPDEERVAKMEGTFDSETDPARVQRYKIERTAGQAITEEIYEEFKSGGKRAARRNGELLRYDALEAIRIDQEADENREIYSKRKHHAAYREFTLRVVIAVFGIHWQTKPDEVTADELAARLEPVLDDWGDVLIRADAHRPLSEEPVAIVRRVLKRADVPFVSFQKRIGGGARIRMYTIDVAREAEILEALGYKRAYDHLMNEVHNAIDGSHKSLGWVTQNGEIEEAFAEASEAQDIEVTQNEEIEEALAEASETQDVGVTQNGEIEKLKKLSPTAIHRAALRFAARHHAAFAPKIGPKLIASPPQAV